MNLSNSLTIACVVLLVASGGVASAGIIYVESGSTMNLVDTSTGTVTGSYSIINSGPMAVVDTIRMRDDAGNTSTEYSLSGSLLGQTSVASFSFFGFDGTTDGVNFNYAMPNSSGSTTVYRYDRDWDNETVLFSFSNSPNTFGLGITYDLSNDTLWVANDVSGNDIKNFDLAGNLLSSFSFSGGLGRPGPLAYDPETDTLWFMTESGNNFLQLSKSGSLLSSFTLPGGIGQGYNMEFAMAPIPEPGTFALLAIGLSGLVAWRRTRRKSA